MPSPPGLAPRRAALSMLDSVLRRGTTLDHAASRHRLEPSDLGLAIAIAGETLRRLPDLDSLIDSATRQRLPDDSKARMVLRLALAQKIGLGTPDHALVATALPLVAGGPRRLVHGVLGTLLRRGLPASDETRLPVDVEVRWAAAWGDAVVSAARRMIIHRPPLDLAFATGADADAFIRQAGATSLAPLHGRLDHHGPIEDLPGFGEGRWWVQDLAASIPARLVPPSASYVVDACAAPGGKTLQLAAAGHRVTALDRSKSRLARLHDNLRRTSLAADVVAADLFDWHPPAAADAVLLDSPCSATGTFRRHPEVLARARPAIIAESGALQARMLDRVAGWLRPGGTLVYAVCSLEPSEGEEQVKDFLGRHHEFELVPAVSPIAAIAPAPEGWLRTVPGMLEGEGGLDGFFAAHLVRRG